MTIYDHKTSANQKAFNSVLDAIELQILKQQKITLHKQCCVLYLERNCHILDIQVRITEVAS